jgi:hypothetical protein
MTISAITESSAGWDRPLAEDRRALHLLSRIPFGPRPGDLEKVRATGARALLERQLHPERIDDSAVEARVAALRTLSMTPEDVLLLTMSEFGRTVQENGNRGTDHGHGNVMLALGAGVRGGRVYGAWPGLRPSARFEDRDLTVTTDFRDVLAEALVRHLGGVDPAPVFPGYRISRERSLAYLAA